MRQSSNSLFRKENNASNVSLEYINNSQKKLNLSTAFKERYKPKITTSSIMINRKESKTIENNTTPIFSDGYRSKEKK